MYLEYFGLTEEPFSITPDPKYAYMSEQHREALAHLVYGVTHGGGFVQLTGEVGTGKTLLCRKLLSQLPEELDLALIFNPRLSPLELTASICDELGIEYPSGCDSIKELVDRLNQRLLTNHSQGRRTVVMIDEAQNLSYDALEQVRLLTNLETDTHKLLRIILVGQPELQRLLGQPILRQLSQRITARYHLQPLSKSETTAYITHRLKVAGLHTPLFSRSALSLLYQHTSGIPRLINVYAGRALLSAYGQQKNQISKRIIHEIVDEMEVTRINSRLHPAWWSVALMIPVTAAWLLLDPLAWFTPGGHSQTSQNIAQAKPAEIQAIASVSRNERTDQQTASNSDTQHIVEPIPPPQVKPEPLMLLATNISTSPDAFELLFSAWGITYQASSEITACEQAKLFALECIYGVGGWQQIEELNRPTVIELMLNAGQRYHAVVSGLVKDEVELDFGDKKQQISRQVLDQIWSGSYLLFWRPPPLQQQTIAFGQRGADVLWLRSALDQALNQPETIPSDNPRLFDEPLRQRVMAFQSLAGLTPDGIAGSKTLIRLKTQLKSPGTPTLN